MMKLGTTHRAKGTENLLEKVLGLLLNNRDISSKAREISEAKLLRKLDSQNISQSTKLILLGLMIAEFVDNMKLSNVSTLFDKLFSQPSGLIGGVDFDLSEQGKTFLKDFKIVEKDIRIVDKIISGVSLRGFKGQMGLSSSTVNKRIKRLCERLGLRNREQLIYVFGYLHLISKDLECLKPGEKVTNLSTG